MEIIKCKDCEYFVDYEGYNKDYAGTKRCNHPKLNFDIECYDHWLDVNEDDFCSYAEPKEIEGE